MKRADNRPLPADGPVAVTPAPAVHGGTVTLLWCLLGLVMPRAAIYGRISPFGISLAAAADKPVFAVLLSLAAGYLLGDTVSPLRYITAVAAVGGLRWVVAAVPTWDKRAFIPPLIAFVASFSTGLALSSAMGLDGYSIVLLLAESGVAAGCSVFLRTAVIESRRLLQRDQPLPLTPSQQFSLVLTGAVLLMAINSLTIGAFSFGRTLCALLVLLLARAGREQGGSMGGIVIGAATALAAPDQITLALALAFGGLLSGVFAHMGRLIQAASFLVSAAILTLVDVGDNALVHLYELIAAVGVFLILPQTIDRRLHRFVLRGRELPAVEGVRRALTMRLQVAANTLSDVAETVGEVTDRLTKCSHRSNEPSYAGEAAWRRLGEIQHSLDDQFSSLAALLDSMARDMNDPRQVDVELSGRVATVCADHGMPVRQAICTRARNNRLNVDILAGDVGIRLHNSRWFRDIQSACGCTFAAPHATACGEDVRILLTEPSRYTVEIGFAQHCCDGETLCGDAVDTFTLDGRTVLILSDGMGSGGRAAVDGAMAAGLTSRLWKAGFSPDSILHSVNAALMIKSRDESLATLDVAVIDTFSGKLDSYKAGAAATLLYSGGRVSRLERPSLPIGILSDVHFDHSTDWLCDGDILVMLSDGALCDGVAAVELLLRDCATDSAQAIAKRIADTAHAAQDTHADDITVLTARVIRT